ncbi:MAG TPA: PQQ-binding-like beta-propeller repeat protein [Caldimonas sp.]|jgi:glucose dehydrogenase/plastocyanin|nr:PQQ-binding-like beta-propeller repeat protein [Caldimonas sp.]HEX2541607.1 PQQ-binding-like beta-propeller repeat protein [Caldimonas sp.]
MTRTFVAPALLAVAVAAAPAATLAQLSMAPTTNDWPHVAGNLASHGYTALTQINKSNIRSLGAAWVTHTAAEPITAPAPAPGTNQTAQQTTPIVVEGVMYLNVAGGGVIALDGATGAVKWKWVPSMAANGYGPATQQRGVSVGEGKVFTTAAGNRMVALNKDTGQVVWTVQPGADGTPFAGVSKVRPTYHDGLVYMGNNDTARGVTFALRASDGSLAWHFYSTYPAGTSFTDVNGATFDAGHTFTTRQTPNDTPNNCYLTAGATPWMHPTIDVELGLLYQTFGNVRSCNGSQNGEGRPGDNLFGSSLVALDLKTGAYKWHFQMVRHDIWDMDNVNPTSFADVMIGGQSRKVLFYGTKSGFQFTLDRTNGKPALPIEYRAVPADTRQAPAPTQPFPLQGYFYPQCVSLQNLGSEVPGDQNRMVPNWNGYQAEPDPANPGQLRLVYRTPNYLTPSEPFLTTPLPYRGCMYDGSYDGFVTMSMTSQNGGNDMTNTSISPRLNMRYIGMSFSPVGHPLQQGGNGLRQIGGYQTGGLAALDNSTGELKWYKPLRLDLSRQHNPLVTATDLLFHTQMDGWLVGRDAATGDELWRFQMGAPSQAGTISYMINGEQYIATTNMAGSQPYSQGGNGDAVWAFKIGGTAKYHTGPRSDPTYVSGSSEAPAPLPIANWRRPVGNTAPGIVPDNEIWMARSNGNANSTPDSVDTGSMVPSQRTVPVGTTVTFRNPGVETFPNSPNLKEHCATQFFEGKFNFRLQPGQTAQYTFDREGEYFYNDCTDPRPVGKVIVTLAPQNMPGALQFVPNVLNLRPAGVFTNVQGLITAVFKVPAGYTLDGNVRLSTPLTAEVFEPVTTNVTGQTLIVTFDKALLDNNIPAGDAVPLTMTANFMEAGVQKKLTSTATVRVAK